MRCFTIETLNTISGPKFHSNHIAITLWDMEVKQFFIKFNFLKFHVNKIYRNRVTLITQQKHLQREKK